MAGFIAYFMHYHAAFIGYKCTGNYVIFQIGARPALAYATYYYGWLLTAIGMGVVWANELQAAGKRAKPRLQMVQALIIGYLVFLVPTTISNSVSPATRSGIPSIMCGFAVLFAIILTMYILPRGAKARIG
jgi:NADH:ubiquinone oxidoreductase subunit 6 (subunit J)